MSELTSCFLTALWMLVLGSLAVIPLTESTAPIGCDQNVTLTKDFPEYATISLPSNLSTPAVCTILIDCSANKTVVATVTTLTLAGVTDTVVVYDGMRVVELYGMQSSYGDVLVSSSNTMRFMVNLDKTNGTRNLTFNAYSQVNGGAFYTEGNFLLNGSLQTSPNYTSFYRLVAAPSQQVQLLLGNSLMHPTEVVEVYDGTRLDPEKLLIRFRSGTSFIPVTGSQGKILLVTTNFNNQEFLNGSFSSKPAGCDEIITGSSGSFQLDREFIKTTCSIVINPHLNGNFTPNSVTVLNLLPSISICQNETLTIYQGMSASGQRLATITYGTQNVKVIPPIYTEAHNGFRLELDSVNANCSDKEKGIAFSGNYWTQPNCGQRLTSSNGTLTSPHYGNMYPLNSHCEWPLMINITGDMTLYISVQDLRLVSQHSLSVTLNNGTVLHKYTGNKLPTMDFVAKVTNASFRMYPVIVFDSSPSAVGKMLDQTSQGFKLKYQILDCGGIHTSRNGSFTAPTTKINKHCIWIISLPRTGANHSVNIIQFTLRASGYHNTSKGSFVIRNGGTSSSPLLLLRDVPPQKPMSYLSDTNQLWVQYSGSFLFNITYNLYNCNKTQQCQNGKCLHPDWRCDGIDQCGDMTDERNCTSPVPPGPAKGNKSGVKVYLVAVIGILCFMFGVILTIIGPAVYKRIRYPNYRHLQDLMEPTVT